MQLLECTYARIIHPCVYNGYTCTRNIPIIKNKIVLTMYNNCGRCADWYGNIVLDEVIWRVAYLAVYDKIINRIQLINMNYLPHDTRRYIQRNNVIIIIIHISYDIIFGASKNQRKWFRVNHAYRTIHHHNHILRSCWKYNVFGWYIKHIPWLAGCCRTDENKFRLYRVMNLLFLRLINIFMVHKVLEKRFVIYTTLV